ncbi:MAG: alkaline phosphatase D family protein [Deltaproteobacteria bacterium]|nr:alkaline phosphatase D family protein [Deltaproteobacteria bacterium]
MAREFLLSRRDLLRAGAAVALAACGDNLDPEALTGPAYAATFDVDATGAVIAVAAPRAAVAAAVVVDRATGDVVAMPTGAIGPGGTARLDVTGLAPDRAYAYTVRCDDGTGSGDFVFATPPAGPRPVRIAYSADIDLDPQFASPIFQTLAAADHDLFVSIGDWPYADNPPGAITLAEYRARHAAVRTPDIIQRWLATTSVRAIYDDHEVKNDWDPRVPAARVDAAMQAWDEWFPIRGAVGDVRYRRFGWGPLVECFLLDCRRYRSDSTAPDGPDKTMLGATQLAWFLDGITTSAAPFKLVFTSVPLAYGYVVEHWGVYTFERDRMLAAIRDAGVTGVLFLTADQHWFAAHALPSGAREFQVGPLARGMPELPPSEPGVLVQIRTYNFGVVEIAPGEPPTLTFRAHDATGALLYEESFTPAALRL